ETPVAHAAGHPETIGKAIRELAEACDLMRQEVRVLPLVVLIGQARDAMGRQELGRRAIEVVDVVAAIEIEAADDPVPLAAGIGGEAQLLDERLLIAVGIEAECNPATECSGEIDEEALIEFRVRGRARELRAIEVIVDG